MSGLALRHEGRAVVHCGQGWWHNGDDGHAPHVWSYDTRGYDWNEQWCPGGSERPGDIDPLSGAICHFCGLTADNFHVSDEVWAKVEPVLGQHQACFKCFRIAAWWAGVRPDRWEVAA